MFVVGLFHGVCFRKRKMNEVSQNVGVQKGFQTPVRLRFFAMVGVFHCLLHTSLRVANYSKPKIHRETAFYLKSLFVALILIQVFPVLYLNKNPFNLLAFGATFFKSSQRLCQRILIDGFRCCNGPIVSRYLHSTLHFRGYVLVLVIYPRNTPLSKSSYFCTTVSTSGFCLSADPVYMAVYRVCFAISSYFLFTIILSGVNKTNETHLKNANDETCVKKTPMVHVDCSHVNHSPKKCVNDKKDPRVDLQCKAWPVKMFLLQSISD